MPKFFGQNTPRLLRNLWRGPRGTQHFAEELAAFFGTLDEQMGQSFPGPISFVDNSGNYPLVTILGSQDYITPLPPGGQPDGRDTEEDTANDPGPGDPAGTRPPDPGLVLSDDGIGFGNAAGAEDPSRPHYKEQYYPLIGIGKITARNGPNQYQAELWNDDPNLPEFTAGGSADVTVSVEAQPLQLLESEVIPTGSWFLFVRVHGKYYFQPPIWYADDDGTSNASGGIDSEEEEAANDATFRNVTVTNSIFVSQLGEFRTLTVSHGATVGSLTCNGALTANSIASQSTITGTSLTTTGAVTASGNVSGNNATFSGSSSTFVGATITTGTVTTLTSTTGNITTVNATTVNATTVVPTSFVNSPLYKASGTSGATGTIDLNTVTSITVSGGIITGYA